MKEEELNFSFQSQEPKCILCYITTQCTLEKILDESRLMVVLHGTQCRTNLHSSNHPKHFYKIDSFAHLAKKSLDQQLLHILWKETIFPYIRVSYHVSCGSNMTYCSTCQITAKGGIFNPFACRFKCFSQSKKQHAGWYNCFKHTIWIKKWMPINLGRVNLCWKV